MDQSGSMWKDHKGCTNPNSGEPCPWEQEKEFVQGLAAYINMSREGSHVAVTVFSNDAELKIKFTDYTTLQSFQAEVGKIRHPEQIEPYKAYGTNINSALKVAYDDMFNEDNGMRQNSIKTLILVTDGTASDNFRVTAYSWGQKFDERGIRVVALGVGRVDSALRHLVQADPDFRCVDNFKQLLDDDFMKNLVFCTPGKMQLELI